MTNLDSILKSGDITSPTKVHLVKTMVFLVVMYGYENWTIKKAEHKRIDAFEEWCSVVLLYECFIIFCFWLGKKVNTKMSFIKCFISV